MMRTKKIWAEQANQMKTIKHMMVCLLYLPWEYGIGNAVEASTGNEEEEKKEHKAEGKGEAVIIVGNEESAPVAAQPGNVTPQDVNISNHVLCMLEQMSSDNKFVSIQDVAEFETRRHSWKMLS